MESGWALVREIINGHRMRNPEFFPKFLREIITKCWQTDPKERPTLLKLTQIFEKFMESLVSFDYLNMNSSANENIQ
jgi:hypothetical protein